MFNKKLIESASVVVLAAVLTVAGVANQNLSANTVVAEETSTEVVTDETDDSLVAGVGASLMTAEAEAVTVVKEAEEVVTASESSTEAEEEAEPEYTEEEAEWLNYLMPTVEDALNVRADAAEDADLVGKLHAGDVATVEEKGDTWTKITSGNVEGYVLNEYCVFGLDALAYAQENVDTIATVQTDGLRIHSEMTTDGSVMDAVSTGYELTVDKDAEVSDGWVAVTYDGETGYVVSDYVTLSYDLGSASTMEEEYAAALAAQKAAEEAAAKKNQSAGAAQSQRGSVAASADDLTILAALVMCEAGGCSYEGQLAVASVVCNRVRSGGYPNSIYSVIYQSGQFGPATSGKLDNTIASGAIYSSCYSAAQEALAGTDNTDGAIGFAYASSGRAGVVYGSVVFFK